MTTDHSTTTTAAARRRPTIYQVRLWAGVIFGVYATMHLLNHTLGLVSVWAQEAARPWIMWVWHSVPGQLALYGSLTVHAGLGLYGLARRRHYRMPAWEAAQIVLGLALPYLLLVHIVNTRGTRVLTGIDIDYVYENAMLWVDPTIRAKQVILVLLVWGHLAVGLHFWLRMRPWYRRGFPLALLLYASVPAISLLGFAQVGKDMTARARADPAWYKQLRASGTPKDPAKAALRTQLRTWAGPAWLGVVGAVFVAATARNWLSRHRTFVVTYPDGRRVRAPKGLSILEVSRMAGRPHMAVCGGRARCTTCRVRVDAADALPAPEPAERRALDRLDAPPGLRLACQLRPTVDVRVQPLLNPSLVANLPGNRHGPEFGQEREVTVLFIDVRGFTKLAQHRLPYDMVFLLNHLFEEMADAVEDNGGHYSNFTGDGLMALFGLTPCRHHGARAALGCAAGMLQRLDHLNHRLAGELEAPISIGIGIHTGVAVVGRMGPPRTPLITALGDTVNTAARLEGLTKDLGKPIVVSGHTLRAARFDPDGAYSEVCLRGRTGTLTVAALDREAVHRLFDAAIPAPAGTAR